MQWQLYTVMNILVFLEQTGAMRGWDIQNNLYLVHIIMWEIKVDTIASPNTFNHPKNSIWWIIVDLLHNFQGNLLKLWKPYRLTQPLLHGQDVTQWQFFPHFLPCLSLCIFGTFSSCGKRDSGPNLYRHKWCFPFGQVYYLVRWWSLIKIEKVAKVIRN